MTIRYGEITTITPEQALEAVLSPHLSEPAKRLVQHMEIYGVAFVEVRPDDGRPLQPEARGAIKDAWRRSRA